MFCVEEETYIRTDVSQHLRISRLPPRMASETILVTTSDANAES